MSFGNIIKKLRLEKNMTQEQLAEVLSISAQAISHWETNTALPDISLIPALANYFDVTTDFLLEVDSSKREKEIESQIEKAQQYTSKGYWSKGIDILRGALKRHPSSYRLLNELAYALYSLPQEKELSSDEHKKLLKEVIFIEESVLENSKDAELRHDAVTLLCYIYPRLGMQNEAEKLAKTMPFMAQCQENLLAFLSGGTKKYQYKQNALFTHLELMLLDMTCNCAPLDNGTKPYTSEEMIQLNKKVIDIINIIFEDGNYGFFSQKIAWSYLNIAWFYAELNNKAEAIKYLQLAKSQAITNDKTEHDPERKYTCLILRGKKYSDIWHNITANDSMHQLSEMEDGVFDFIRNDTEFQSITEELKQYADCR